MWVVLSDDKGGGENRQDNHCQEEELVFAMSVGRRRKALTCSFYLLITSSMDDIAF
jgi:hypothetical protein